MKTGRERDGEERKREIKTQRGWGETEKRKRRGERDGEKEREAGLTSQGKIMSQKRKKKKKREKECKELVMFPIKIFHVFFLFLFFFLNPNR